MKARLPKGYGRPDPNAMMRQVQKMQDDIRAKQEELEAKEYTGTASGEMVTVTMNGKHEITAVKIKPEAVDPDDIEMLEAVGYGFLMENGSPELRSRVPYLAPPNTEYGVARVLQQVLRQKGCVCPADFTKAH